MRTPGESWNRRKGSRSKIAGGIPRFWSCIAAPEADMIQVKE